MATQTETFKQKFEESLNSIYHLVEQVLVENVNARNYDNILIKEAWLMRKCAIEEDGFLKIPTDKLIYVISPQTIGRMRRKIQSPIGKGGEQRLLPTRTDIIIKRRLSMDVCKDYYRKRILAGQTCEEEVAEARRNEWLL